VALWTVGGSVALAGIVGLTLWIRVAEGPTVEEPQSTFLVGAASGAHAPDSLSLYRAAENDSPCSCPSVRRSRTPSATR